MKIAMPLAKGRIADLSENCDRFTIVDVYLTENRILDSCRRTRGRVVGSARPWLAEQAVDLVIAAEVRPEMKINLMEINIRIIAGAPNDSPHSVIKAYLARSLDQPDSLTATPAHHRMLDPRCAMLDTRSAQSRGGWATLYLT